MNEKEEQNKNNIIEQKLDGLASLILEFNNHQLELLRRIDIIGSIVYNELVQQEKKEITEEKKKIKFEEKIDGE